MITRLRVRNFKSLRDVDISLGPLNVLVGPNMAGKSNILDVLMFLHQVFFPEGGAQGINYALAKRGGVNEVLWKGSDESLITINLECRNDNDPTIQYQYLIEIVAGVGGFASVQKESLTLLRNGATIELLGKEADAPHSPRQFRNADGTNIGGVSQSGTSAMQYAYSSWDGYKFLEYARGWRHYRLVPFAMKSSSPVSAGNVLTEDGSNLSSWLLWLQSHSPEAFGRIKEVLGDLFADISDIKVLPTGEGNAFIAILEKDLKRPINVWQTSDGFLQLLALLSLIYVPPQLSGTLFLVEEPENHLHPRLLETLVALLRQVRQEISQSRQPLTQILLTTQSPYLVDQFHLDEIIWVEKKNGETSIFRPSDKKHLRELVENKELGLGDLLYTGALGNEK